MSEGRGDQDEAARDRDSTPLLAGVINVSLAVGALVVTCLILHALLPSPEISDVTAKLEFFKTHKNEIDTLFIGSSRTYQQISPAIFDDIMRRHGRPTHSFNFGINGMHMPESSYVLDLILKAKPQGLKFVLIEFDVLQLKPWLENRKSQRVVYWHDWTRTLLAMRKILDTNNRDFPHRKLKRLLSYRSYITYHLGLFSKNYGNVGRAADLLGAKGDAAEPRGGPDVWKRTNGYRPTNPKLSAAQLTAYEQTLAGTKLPEKPPAIDQYGEEAFRICAEKIRQSGAIPIFVVPPSVRRSPVRFPGKGPTPGAVLVFNDFVALPQLYHPGARINASHVNKKGAEEFTRLLAKRVARGLARSTIR